MTTSDDKVTTDPHAAVNLGPASPPDRVTVAYDTDLALELIEHHASLTATQEVRDRLRDHINALADAADSYAHALDDSRARDVAIDTVRHARAVASDAGHRPEIQLRLLAKSAQTLARYAAARHR
ncbi:hypothetical protein [Streptomyces sp. DB-54]